MAFKEYNSLKLYFSIGEAAEILDVNTSLIQFWEKVPILKPKKNKKVIAFRKMTLKILIYHLVKERGFTLQGARKT